MEDFATAHSVDMNSVTAFEAEFTGDPQELIRARLAVPTVRRIAHRIPVEPIVPPDLGFAAPGPSFNHVTMVNEIIERMEEAGSVGFSWAIARGGQLVDAGGVGDARTPAETNPRPMRARTRMVSASLAKPICAVTVMKLVEDGTLSLDQAAYPLIQGNFPGGHSDLNDITIRHLLTHRSGFNGPGLLSAFAGTLSQPLDATPGTSTRYENWNYWFLAHVVEAVTGAPFVRVARQTVLLPMGIRRLTRRVNEDIRCLYYQAGATSGGGGWGDFEATAIGAYGWYGNAVHWARFLAHFRFDTVLSRETRQIMLEAEETYFGFRHWRGRPRGDYYGHGGDFFRSEGAFHGGMVGFADGVDAVLLTNSDDVSNPENVLIAAYHAAFR